MTASRTRNRVFPLLFSTCWLFAGCAGDPEASKKPKAICPNPQAEFGKMVVGTEVHQVYTIRNDGEAVLELGNPTPIPAPTKYEMRCELASRSIPPGGQTTAKLTLRPLEANRKLYAGVHVPTNEAESARLRFGGRLQVEELIQLSPPDDVDGTWNLKTDREYRGTIHSVDLKNFEITELKSDHPGITAEAVPLTTSQRRELGAKCGYSIIVSPAKSVEIGRYSSQLTIQTNAGEGITKTRRVKGVWLGPLRIVIANNAEWSNQNLFALLGEFSSIEGKTATLKFVLNAPKDGEPVTWERVTTSDPLLSGKLGDSQTKEGVSSCMLTLNVAGGQAPAIRNQRNPVEVVLSTNHPEARRIRFHVYFISR